MIEAFLSVRFAELVDLAVVWAMVWGGIVWLRAAPARLALAGLGILVAIYLLARQLGLVLTTWILQGFAAVAVLVAVVVFQQDLRQLFEQIAALGFRRRLLPASSDAIDTLVRAIVNLAERHRGALIVLPGREAVDGHVEGGLPLNADVTEPLLLSIFDPHSPGHDGAAIFTGDRVTRFAVHLPLSPNRAQLGQRGTRPHWVWPSGRTHCASRSRRSAERFRLRRVGVCKRFRRRRKLPARSKGSSID